MSGNGHSYAQVPLRVDCPVGHSHKQKYKYGLFTPFLNLSVRRVLMAEAYTQQNTAQSRSSQTEIKIEVLSCGYKR